MYLITHSPVTSTIQLLLLALISSTSSQTIINFRGAYLASSVRSRETCSHDDFCLKQKNGAKTVRHWEGGWIWLEPILGEKINIKGVYIFIMWKSDFDGNHNQSNAILVCTVDACHVGTWSSSFALIQVRKKCIYRLNVTGKYLKWILLAMSIIIITCTFIWNDWLVTALSAHVQYCYRRINDYNYIMQITI